jgi:hypothetical protein
MYVGGITVILIGTSLLLLSLRKVTARWLAPR